MPYQNRKNYTDLQAGGPSATGAPRRPQDAPKTPCVSHVVATNWSPEEKAAQDVLDWHNERGQAENMIKELKHGVGLERVPCSETGANAIWFRLGVIAYTLIIGFQRLTCPTAWTRHAIATTSLGPKHHPS
jgi:hypothetical protein